MRALIFFYVLLLSNNSYSFEKHSIAVVINDEIVTTFDIRREIYYDRVQRGINWNQYINEKEVKEFVPVIVEKWLIAQEGVKFGVTEVTPEDVIDEVSNFKAKFKTPKDYDLFMNVSNFSPADIERVLSREIQSREFLKIKLPSIETQTTKDRAFRRWIIDLRSRANLIYVLR